MRRVTNAITVAAWLTLLFFAARTSRAKQSRLKSDVPKKPNRGAGPPVLWRDPGDVRRDLFYSPGGKAHAQRHVHLRQGRHERHQPQVRRCRSRWRQWRLNWGRKPVETVASRLVWGVGYFANGDYFVRSSTSRNAAPASQAKSRFGEAPAHDVRMKQHLRMKRSIPVWAKEPFTGRKNGTACAY